VIREPAAKRGRIMAPGGGQLVHNERPQVHMRDVVVATVVVAGDQPSGNARAARNGIQWKAPTIVLRSRGGRGRRFRGSFGMEGVSKKRNLPLVFPSIRC
jgi:hypothetical protein